MLLLSTTKMLLVFIAGYHDYPVPLFTPFIDCIAVFVPQPKVTLYEEVLL